jgi:hypothetical protein
MARRALIIANVVLVVVVITCGFMVAFVSTDRGKVERALDHSGKVMATLLDGADTAPPGYAEEQKDYVAFEISHYFDWHGERRASGNSGTDLSHNYRIEWNGAAPRFTGTRIIATTRGGGELGTLTVRDLSEHDWEIETTSPLLFWR